MGRFKLLAWFSDDQQGLFQRCYNGTLTTLTVFFCVDSKTIFYNNKAADELQDRLLFCFVLFSYLIPICHLDQCPSGLIYLFP